MSSYVGDEERPTKSGRGVESPSIWYVTEVNTTTLTPTKPVCTGTFGRISIYNFRRTRECLKPVTDVSGLGIYGSWGYKILLHDLLERFRDVGLTKTLLTA